MKKYALAPSTIICNLLFFIFVVIFFFRFTSSLAEPYLHFFLPFTSGFDALLISFVFLPMLSYFLDKVWKE